MTDAIRTERLTLRRFLQADVPAVVSALQDRDVARMLPLLPWPYTAQDALEFITGPAAATPLCYAVAHENRLVGCVGITDHLGYWLGRAGWGQGFATEAARAVLDLHFAADHTPLRSGHRPENAASRRVLLKLGFRDTVPKTVFCNAEGHEVTIQQMELTHAAWKAVR